MASLKLNRRSFLRLAAATAGALAVPACQPRATASSTRPPQPAAAAAQSASAGFEADLAGQMEALGLPGLAVAIATNRGVAWSRGLGWADRERGQAMTADTVMNIASTSKTITATALMQLWEAGRFELDDDVGQYLPFGVRNPSHAQQAITFRHLLTHQASIVDSDVYRASYACGDPTVALGDWLRAYFDPSGNAYSAENYAPWAPGERWAYSNLGFGLAGYLVEVLGGQPFGEYCRDHIFAPLGMAQTSFYLRDLEGVPQATPYGVRGAAPNLTAPAGRPAPAGLLVPLCQYGFPNLPDGLVRTSANQLARFAAAMLNGGTLDGARLLEPETSARMFTAEAQAPYGPDTVQGLGWFAIGPGSERAWGHTGGDPGITSHLWLNHVTGTGVVALANAGADLLPIARRLFEYAYQAG